MTESISKRQTKKTSNSPKKTKLNVRVVDDGFRFKDRIEGNILEQNESLPVSKPVSKKNNFKTKEIKSKKEVKAEKPKIKSKSINLYRRIASTFIILTAILLIGVFYVYFVKMTVEVTPNKDRISDKISFTVKSGDNKGADSTINGAVEQLPVKKEKTFQATGANVLGKEITGKVTIFNKQAKSQTLIATTRVMSPDGKVFRIKDRVDIPANGSQEVEIYADEPTQDMAIGPTTFTLPALWAGMQDKVYATSNQAFTYDTQVEKYIQQVDINNGLQELEDTLMAEAKTSLGDSYKGFDKVIFAIDNNSLQIKNDAKANDKVDQFTISVDAVIDVIAFDKKDSEKLVEDRLASIVPVTKKIVSSDKNDIQYNLTSTDFNAGQAVIEASFSGLMSSKNTNDLVDKTKLIGLNEDQVKAYLEDSGKFSDVKISFFPSFMKKSPTLLDRIKVVVKD